MKFTRVEAIKRELVADGLVQHYSTTTNIDGFPPGEGTFLPCSFWLADNLALVGRLAEAEALFERLLSLRNDLGLNFGRIRSSGKTDSEKVQAFLGFAQVGFPLGEHLLDRMQVRIIMPLIGVQFFQVSPLCRRKSIIKGIFLLLRSRH